MPSSSRLRPVGLGIFVIGTLLASTACSHPVADQGDDEEAATKQSFNPNNVLDDEAMTDYGAMSEADVQAFLEKKNPWGTPSVLATYKEGGKTAAQIFHGAATKYKINPLVLLTRAHVEQGLIHKKTATQSSIEIALGCGCPHSSACSKRYVGLAAQAECAAGLLRRNFDLAGTTKGTASGWKVCTGDSKAKCTKKSLDSISVSPENRATATLYTYTPWVGAGGGGKHGGNALHRQVWDSFADAIDYASGQASKDTTKTGSSGNTGSSSSNGSSKTGSTDNGSAGNGSADNGSAGNGSAGNGSADNGSGSNTDKANRTGTLPTTPTDTTPTDTTPTDTTPTTPDTYPNDPAQDPNTGSTSSASTAAPNGSNVPSDTDPFQQQGTVGGGNAETQVPAASSAKKDLPRASDKDLASQSSGGCSVATPGGGSSTWLALGAAVASILGRRRRRERSTASPPSPRPSRARR